MKLKAYAKVNLGLNVFQKKSNETKHKIFSLMVKLKNVYDLIEIKIDSQKDSITYFADGKHLIIENCLLKKTLAYLRKHFQINHYYQIVVYKNIPVGAGLGGGSSDSASLINYVLKKEKINNSQLNYYDIAINLGSDIPFFIHKNKYCLVSNYGDQITPIKIPNNLKISLHLMNTSISTANVFQQFDIIENKSDNINNYTLFIENIKQKKDLKLINDLQEPCLSLHPELIPYWNQYLNQHDYIIMSGSGATIVGLDYKKG